MKRIYDITVANGKYQNKQGEEKTSYLKIGVVFEREDGSQCMKLESVPIKFDGWANFYKPDLRKVKEDINKAKPDFDEGDEIPF